jgi:hypothetical protein
LLLLATLLLGSAEVLRDNAADVHAADRGAGAYRACERADVEHESVANTFIGPPIGRCCPGRALGAVRRMPLRQCCAPVAPIPGSRRAPRACRRRTGSPWRTDLKEGVRWLWGNHLLRSMAIILGLMNLASNVSGAMFVLFAQDVLRVTPLTFTVMGFGFAVGAIVGGYAAPWLSRTLGSGTCLALTLGSASVIGVLVGLSSWWPLTAVLFAVGTLLGSTWNVITVSLRQTIIPPHLLGRVNSVYRFFAWGMMPIGALLGGLVVLVAGRFVSHSMALRCVWFVDAAITSCSSWSVAAVDDRTVGRTLGGIAVRRWSLTR